MKLPKLPRKIRVMTRVYSIRYNRKLGPNIWGRCNRANAEIEINPDKCGNVEQIYRTLWHEIGHAFAWENGLCSSGMSEDAEEFFVETFSALICDLTDGKIRQRR